jgi:hypothetical protein
MLRELGQQQEEEEENNYAQDRKVGFDCIALFGATGSLSQALKGPRDWIAVDGVGAATCRRPRAGGQARRLAHRWIGQT